MIRQLYDAFGNKIFIGDTVLYSYSSGNKLYKEVIAGVFPSGILYGLHEWKDSKGVIHYRKEWIKGPCHLIEKGPNHVD